MTRKQTAVEQHLLHGDYTVLTDDVEWFEVGAPKPARGKQEYIEYGKPGPEIASMRTEISRMMEDGSVVVAEGMVTLTKKDGTSMKVQYCDVFDFDGDRIKRKTSYANVVPS